jgi:hypothetical protein
MKTLSVRHPLRSLVNFMKLASSFDFFFKAIAHRARHVRIEEARTKPKILK